MTGTVYLVGAGPGDPGLITCAGARALEQADVVVYDRLAHPRLLDLAPAHAEKLFVGKASARHFVTQEDTNALLVDRALAGKTVVRLKGGDPLVFGRGAEEARFLRDHGVPFVLIPGITSAIAAPAYAGIPVTHRDAASSFAVITGHERDDRGEAGSRVAGSAEPRRRWDRIAHAADTLVFLMGVEALGEITTRLIEHGRDPQTPVGIVEWGTWSRQRVVTGTLDTIVDVARAAGIKPPGVTVVGDVVRYRESLRWFDNRPLFGKRIVVTRAREQASELALRLEALGADVLTAPALVRLSPADDYAALDAALMELPSYRWVVFTSANAVEETFARLTALGRDARAFGGARVAAVGPSTERRLAEKGIRADFVPTEFVAEAILAQFPDADLSGARLLLPRAAEARDVLPDAWRAAGARVDVVEAYRMEPSAEGAEAVREALAAGEVDAITFASSNTVRYFVEAVGAGSVAADVTLAAIGPITAATCTELLRAPDVVSEAATIDSLVDALVQRWSA